MTFRDSTPDYLQILGHNRFVNSVLAEHLSLQTGLECRVQNGLEFESEQANDTEFNITLIDVSSYDLERVSELLNDCSINQQVLSVGLLHLLEGKEAESLLSYPKVKGLFYQGATRAHISKGIDMLVSGGYWIPRRLLERMLESNRRTPGIKAEVTIHSLTRREREILKMATTGATNKQIAESLGVSAHTVKTHIYNLFKKLGASNRVQATSWAKTHASELLL